MYPVSLDSPAKQDNFNRLIAQDAQRYFWTGEREQQRGGRGSTAGMEARLAVGEGGQYCWHGGTGGSRDGERSRAGEGR